MLNLKKTGMEKKDNKFVFVMPCLIHTTGWKCDYIVCFFKNVY